ncbi:MAG: hypothetical protein AUK48_03170 [Oscillatoriales cyanobacterium CG2_30_44_21]|nr:MAG: hypothetical protein AUK48_03170 [Oscillatoriales cyanobacterium CG2_30_44_21]
MIGNYDGYVYAIALLLPISALMLVSQTNPYNALVLRGILGAMSALIYTILGAADVALTEALVGSFLATMLYAVAVRSSLVLRLGVIENVAIAHDLAEEIDKLTETSVTDHDDPDLGFKKLIEALNNTFSKHYMRVELVPYSNVLELEQALVERDVHATLYSSNTIAESQSYQIKIRLNRLYEIIQADPVLANSQLANVQLI